MESFFSFYSGNLTRLLVYGNDILWEFQFVFTVDELFKSATPQKRGSSREGKYLIMNIVVIIVVVVIIKEINLRGGQ